MLPSMQPMQRRGPSELMISPQSPRPAPCRARGRPRRSDQVAKRRLRAKLASLILDASPLDASFDGMRSEDPTDTLVPPDLLVEVEAAAEEEREPRELVREAVA